MGRPFESHQCLHSFFAHQSIRAFHRVKQRDDETRAWKPQRPSINIIGRCLARLILSISIVSEASGGMKLAQRARSFSSLCTIAPFNLSKCFPWPQRKQFLPVFAHKSIQFFLNFVEQKVPRSIGRIHRFIGMPAHHVALFNRQSCSDESI